MIWHRVFYNFFGTEIHKRLGAIRKRLGAIHKGLGAIYKKLGAIYKKLGAKILAPKLYTPFLMVAVGTYSGLRLSDMTNRMSF